MSSGEKNTPAHQREADPGVWHEQFVEDVDLSKVAVEGIDPNWKSTKGYSRRDIEQIVDDLSRVQSMRDRGSQDEDFRRLRESSDPAQRRLGDTERIFYSGKKDLSERSGREIQVVWQHGGWNVERGRHRVSVAMEKGLTSIPAVVKAPSRNMIDDIRLDRHRKQEERLSMESSKSERQPAWARDAPNADEREAPAPREKHEAPDSRPRERKPWEAAPVRDQSSELDRKNEQEKPDRDSRDVAKIFDRSR